MTRLFCLIAAVGFLYVPRALPQQSGIIAGVARNRWSKAPVKKAIVTLRTNGAEPLEALTYSDANGAFAFTGVPAGEYSLCARLAGYERACFGGGNEQAGQPISLFRLAAGEQKQNVVLPMLPTGSLTGTVTDADGDPVSNAPVRLLRPVYQRRTLHWVSAAGAVTNSNGEYHLTFLHPGEYRVMANHFGVAMRPRPEAVAGQPVVEEVYTPQYYPGATSIDSAASLTLNPGNDMKGIDFTLGTAPLVAVGGVVHPAAGMSKDATVTVQFFSESSTGTEPTANFEARAPDYAFQANVAAGRYHVIASCEDEDRFYRAEQLADAGTGPNTITLTLTGGSPLSGILQVEGGPKGNDAYTIQLTPGGNPLPKSEPPDAEVAADGTFEIPNVLPGIWDIGVNPLPPGSYIKSMRLGEQDVLTADMKLDEGTRKKLTIVVSTKGGVVSGNVIMHDQPGTDFKKRARLLLAPSGKNEDVLSFYQTTVSDGKGHYEFTGVTPGAYRIFAFDRLQQDEFWKPDFLKPFAPAAGDAIVIREGAKITQDVPVIVRDPELGE